MGNLFLSWGFGSHYPHWATSSFHVLSLEDLFPNQKDIYLEKGSLSDTKHNLSFLNRGQTPPICNPCSRRVFPPLCPLQGGTLASGICFLQEFSRASLCGSGGYPGEEPGFGKPQAQLSTLLQGAIQNQGGKEPVGPKWKCLGVIPWDCQDIFLNMEKCPEMVCSVHQKGPTRDIHVCE